MKAKLFGSLLLALGLCTSIYSCARNPSRVQGPVEHYSLPYYYWSNTWMLTNGEMRFFDLDLMMKELQLTRLEAVEVQNFYRDYMDAYWKKQGCSHQENYDNVSYRQYFSIDVLSCFNVEIRQAAWELALAKVKAGEKQSGWSEEKLNKAKFVVAFDLDNTLFFQNWKKEESKLYMAPGWLETLEFVKSHGGAVILFTAKNDLRTYKTVIPQWFVEKDGQKIPITDYVDAIFTNNHTTMSAEDRDTKTQAVIMGSKDLRIIEENLTKTFIVDDLPARIVQFDLLRHVARWDPEKFQNIDGGNNIITSPNRLMDAVKEIAESVEYAQAHNITPAKAFLPYSFQGRQITNQLAIEQFKGNFQQAVQYVRDNPVMVTAIK